MTARTIGIVRNLLGRSGWLTVECFSVRSLEEEDRLLCIGIDDMGQPLPEEACQKLFQVAGHVAQSTEMPSVAAAQLEEHRARLHDKYLAEISERNNRYFEQEIDKLDRWAEDLKQGLEREIKEMNADITQLGKQARLVPNLAGKLELQRQKKELESLRKRKQQELFGAQDQIESRKESLLAAVEARLQQQVEHREILTIAWEVQ